MENRVDIVSTYRLQFHKGFTFRDATAIIPYLHDLGITHVYASPYLKAVTGSTHGYDVIDHGQLNPEIGTEHDYQNFVAALAAKGMSHILDTVPNHMGVETNDNQWWNDVLANGADSKYANYFDIDWEGFAPRRELHGKVLLAVLGDTFAQTLREGKLQLQWEDGKPFVCYYARQFPISPSSNTDSDLSDLLADQHYRLSSWRVASDEINYRRFFDISSLAALQMQRKEVFDAVHDYTFSLIARGSVAGLRVDHPDGLFDPKQYFQRLQAKYADTCPQQAAAGTPLFVSVEKILNGDETLCDDWPVSGTSGYDFLYAVNDLFVASSNESLMTDIYVNFVGDRTSYADWVYRNKCLVLDTAMYSEMCTLANRLDALAQAELSSRDFTRRQLHEALREVIACFSVYRSYVSSRGVSESDVAMVDQAVKQAATRNPRIEAAALKFIRDSILLRYPVPDSVRDRQLNFAMRFQQLSSPVNAKGIEDSTFYIYNRLTSLNEVGGDPGRFGRPPQAIHEYFAHRQARWPLSLSALSTHDTKRSEDVRARLNILSEIPAEWYRRLQRWRDLNAHLCGNVHPNDQYLLYQSIVGAWPLEPMDGAGRSSFVKRIWEYMQKATREAKVRTSWINPDKNYEASLSAMIEKMLAGNNEPFLSEFLPFQKRISYLGMMSSLSQTILRLTAPGICDTYQGTELWDFSLVDPDNRRPVNYEDRTKSLARLNSEPDHANLARQLLENMEDGRIKLWIHRQLLHQRRRLPDLFLKGSYEPIVPSGKVAANVFSFARVWDQQSIIVVVPRLVATLLGDDRWNQADWGDTKIAIPQGCGGDRFENILAGHQFNATADRELPLSQICNDFPVAVLASSGSSNSRN